jgi:hypothetical protein
MLVLPKLSKRKKFVLTSAILSLGFVVISLMDNQHRLLSIGVLSFSTLVLFAWALYEGLGINTTLLALILPPLYTLGVGLFWFLLPATIFARLPIVILYGLGLYALSLTNNIFTVSSFRTIALVRAARGVGFVLTLIVSFLLFDAVLSIKVSIFWTAILSFAVSFPLFMQGLWTSSLSNELLKNRILLYSLLFSLSILQIATFLYFWPVTVVVGSLFLTVSVYILLGLGQARVEDRLFSRTMKEYLTVGLIVFITIFLATRWGG